MKRPTKSLVVDQSDGVRLVWIRLFGSPQPRPSFPFITQPIIWQGAGGRFLRQYFGVPLIGRATAGTNQTAPQSLMAMVLLLASCWRPVSSCSGGGARRGVVEDLAALTFQGLRRVAVFFGGFLGFVVAFQSVCLCVLVFVLRCVLL